MNPLEMMQFLRYKMKFGHLGAGSRLAMGSRIRNPGKVWVGKRVVIDPMVYINGASRNGIKIGDDCRIRYGAYIDGWKGEGITLGSKVFVGPYTIIQGQGGVTIGKDSLISGHVYIVSASHNYRDPSTKIREQGESCQGVKIGSDCWIGASASILDGVIVGDGAVVGAGAVVNRDIPEYSVAAGVPAKVIRKRD